MNEQDNTSNNEIEVEDTSTTAPEVKACLQELLKFGLLEEARKGPLFRHAIVHEAALIQALEPLDLTLKLDTHRGLAFLAVSDTARTETDAGEEWSHPLVRRHRFTLEQSLVIALLRQAFLLHEQELGVGRAPAKVAVDDLLPHFIAYMGDSGSDSRNESRITSLLDQLKSHAIITEIDKNHEVTIRPLIAHLANPESLTHLLTVMEENIREAS